ncbi:MAG: HAMP domain-containing histidine kinase [Prevotellaceae bacterium]|jgi:signal transduction histidine kinase|nr:HAMP domain-containing histidine kinase [Prevotellaceae bacterium]
MKLIYHLSIRISVVAFVLLAVWAPVFYFIIIDEINDETDDFLEDRSEKIIAGVLAGKKLPAADDATDGNSYSLVEVSGDYARDNRGIKYFNGMIYLEAEEEEEPARILKTVFRDAENKYYELTVSTPVIEKEDLQEAILNWIILLYCLLLLGIVVMNVWVLRRSFRPLYKALDWLDSFTVGKNTVPLENETNITEFRKLNEAVIRSARRNEEIYGQQKLFIGNASHELQTPVAVAMNRLELLADDPELTEKQLGEIVKTQQSLKHLSKLNKTLLLLSKIDNGQFPGQKEINVNEHIKKLLDDYAEVYAYRNITVSLTEETTLKILMNEELASIMLGNLLKNAFIHNDDHGFIDIFIASDKIVFSNTGANSPLEPDKIFKRFYQGSKKEGSTGLGLALTDSICKLYSIKAGYRFSNRKHHFSVSF